jgi:two-component system response regulator FlrC
LAVQTLEIPNLSDRLGDLRHLAHRFLSDLNQATGQEKSFSSDFIRALSHTPFDRNVKELSEVVERAFFRTKGQVIDEVEGSEEMVPSTLHEKKWEFQHEEVSQSVVKLGPGVSLSEMERRLILQTLEMTKQNRTRAAEILGISIRTLRNKLQEYRDEGSRL